jgi:UPF0042 nucleotide-binding protein
MTKAKKNEIIIITGLSGAGKSVAIKSIEDLGGFCVDNMPAVLIDRFAQLIRTSDYSQSLLALGLDVRSLGFMDGVFDILGQIKKMGFQHKVVFIEASDSTIVRRYSESRRRHPLKGARERLDAAIERERQSLSPLREKADVIIDTSSLAPNELKQKLKEILFEEAEKSLNISIMSFGFKYGIPEDVDMLIDTRFLPNPHYIDKLSPKDGNNPEIKRFVMRSQVSKELLARYKDMLDFLVPNYVKEGKSYLNIGVGCTGGKHRSVVMANEICKYLLKKKYSVYTKHRDIKRLTK